MEDKFQKIFSKQLCANFSWVGIERGSRSCLINQSLWRLNANTLFLRSGFRGQTNKAARFWNFLNIEINFMESLYKKVNKLALFYQHCIILLTSLFTLFFAHWHLSPLKKDPVVKKTDPHDLCEMLWREILKFLLPRFCSSSHFPSNRSHIIPFLCHHRGIAALFS